MKGMLMIKTGAIRRIMESIVAAENNEDNALEAFDVSIDNILSALELMKESILLLKPENEEQRNAIEKISKIIEEAIEPYLGDLIEESEKFIEE